MEQIHVNFTKFNSLMQIADYFCFEEICKAAIAQQRWYDGNSVCPYCGCSHTYMTAEGRYICKECASHFSVLVGTIFENTKISLRKWFMAIVPHIFAQERYFFLPAGKGHQRHAEDRMVHPPQDPWPVWPIRCHRARR